MSTVATGTTATTTPGRSHLAAALAFARCMRSHGVPDFPDPDSQGGFPAFGTGVAKTISAAANEACKHLLASGGTASPQQLRQKLAIGLKVARCLRANGYRDFPDPSPGQGQQIPSDIDTRSPQFQAVETRCEQQSRKALGLP